MKKYWWLMIALIIGMTLYLSPVSAAESNGWVELAKEQLSSLIGAVQEATPTVTQALLDVTWATALVNILSGFAGLVFALFFAWLSYYCVKVELKKSYSDHPGHIFASIGAAVVAAFCGLGFVINTLNFWNWIGLYRPDLYLIHQIIEKVTSN